MECFVASAFGRDDVDQLYDRTLSTLLVEKGVRPIRVDKLEFNGNVDDRIIAEIARATFVIADLTYARPSVYYEAGFAERQIPVIYTARRDHLAAQPDDDQGNRRIHFDLLMKNIITWSKPDDAEFRAALSGRIDLVLQSTLARLRRRKAGVAKPAVAYKARDIETAMSRLLSAAGFCNLAALKKRGKSGTFIWGEYEWYRLFGGCLTWLRFRFPYFPSRSDYHTPYGHVDYNLNALDKVNDISSIRELMIYSDDSIDLNFTLDKIIHDLVAIVDFDIDVPIVPASFAGDMFLDDQDLAGILTGAFFGHNLKHGFRTKTPPPGMDHVKASVHSEFRFVYGGFKTRNIPVERFVFAIDAVTSVANFEARVRNALRDDPTT